MNWGEVELLDPNNDVLASASSSSSGAIATISAFTLPGQRDLHDPGSGTGRRESSSTGNYVLSAYNVTPNNYSLSVNQTTTGTIHGAYGVDQYSFTASANEQVELNVISAAGGNVAFSLTGPGGTRSSRTSTSNSGPVTLPSSGTYVLTVQGNGGQGGAYAFELEQTSVTNLTLGTPYSGTLAGSGQAQLFAVSVPATQSLVGHASGQLVGRRQPDLRQAGLAADAEQLWLCLLGRRLGQPAVARPLGGAGDLVHPGLLRVGAVGERVHAVGVRRAGHADHRRPRGIRRRGARPR